MPRSWHDRHTVNKIEDLDKQALYRSIVADRKPYFMRYIYPALMKQYNTYIKNTDKNALREFQMTVSQLQDLPEEDLTERQKEFLRYFNYRMPVGINECVMNKICKEFERAFDGRAKKSTSAEFDYTILKGGHEYSARQFAAIKRLYSEYNKRLASYAMFANYERIDSSVAAAEFEAMQNEFEIECANVCSDRYVLCDIILDVCYTRSATKRFAWNMCGQEIIHNLLEKSGGVISWPEKAADGTIEYCGEKYAVRTKNIMECVEDDCSE